MFSMNSIGQKICKLRKEHNMTQLEMADKLGITYQAVSSWERGNSMPDIAKLPEVANLFGVSIDELIGDSKVVNAFVNDDTVTKEEVDNFDEEEIKEALPLLKPSQVDDTFKKMDKKKIVDLGAFLPFISEDDVKELAFSMLEEGDDFTQCLPFMDEEDVYELASQALNLQREWMGCLPFMDEDDVYKLALKLLGLGMDYTSCLPFMDDDAVGRLLKKAMGK